MNPQAACRRWWSWILAATVFAPWQAPADAATFYWSGTNSTLWTNTSGAWSSSAASQITPTGTPGSADDVVFNGDAFNAADKTVNLNQGGRAANSLLFKSSGTTGFIRQSGTNSSGSNLTIGGGGITLNAGVGAVVFGGTDNKVNVRLLSSLAITNNSSSMLRFYQTLETSTSAAPGVTTLTITGSGTGGVQVDDVIGNNATTGTLALVVNTGSASLTNLKAANTFSGGVTLTQGVLGVGSSSALGANAVAISGGALASTSSARTLANSFTIGGNFTLGGQGQPITLNGGMDLGGATRTMALGNSATIVGVISNGGLVLSGSSGGSVRRLLLSGSNSYSGGTTVASGTLQAGSAAAFGTAGVTVSGGVVDLGARADVANTFTMSGGLLTNGTILAAQLGGGAGTVNAVISGTADFIKAVSGVLIFTNASAYSGASLITAGSLLVNGTLSQSAATVASAATLGGTGAVTAGLTVQAGGFVEPGSAIGNAVGTLSTGPLSMAGTYVATITGTDASRYDLLAVAGNADFTGGTIQPVLHGYTPVQNDSFPVATWTGSRTGTPSFDFSSAPLSSGLSWDTSSFVTTGILTVVPEPTVAAVAMCLAALALAVFRRRRPRQAA